MNKQIMTGPETQEIIQEIPFHSMDELLSNSMNNIINTNVTDPYYHLSETQIQWMKDFMYHHPTFCKEVHSQIQEIVQDHLFDLHDIPAIIKVMVTMYHSREIKNEMTDPQHILALIKYMFHIFIDYQFLLPNNIEKQCLETMVDHSLDLLQYNLIPIEKEAEQCCSYLASLYLYFR